MDLDQGEDAHALATADASGGCGRVPGAVGVLVALHSRAALIAARHIAAAVSTVKTAKWDRSPGRSHWSSSLASACCRYVAPLGKVHTRASTKPAAFRSVEKCGNRMGQVLRVSAGIPKTTSATVRSSASAASFGPNCTGASGRATSRVVGRLAMAPSPRRVPTQRRIGGSYTALSYVGGTLDEQRNSRHASPRDIDAPNACGSGDAARQKPSEALSGGARTACGAASDVHTGRGHGLRSGPPCAGRGRPIAGGIGAAGIADSSVRFGRPAASWLPFGLSARLHRSAAIAASTCPMRRANVASSYWRMARMNRMAALDMPRPPRWFIPSNDDCKRGDARWWEAISRIGVQGRAKLVRCLAPPREFGQEQNSSRRKAMQPFGDSPGREFLWLCALCHGA